jgi:energy-coupling factor transporter ATP-binding protein EcfA2
MAQIVQEEIAITISKLAKNGSASSILTSDQMDLVLETVTKVIEEVLDDPGIIVEAAKP